MLFSNFATDVAETLLNFATKLGNVEQSVSIMNEEVLDDGY